MFSVTLSLRRNLGRTIAVGLVVALGVAGSIIVSAVFGAFGDTRLEMKSIDRRWVWIRTETLSFDPSKLSHLPEPAVTFRETKRLVLGHPMLGTAIAGVAAHGFEPDALDDVVRHLGIEISEGRLPSRPDEVALPALWQPRSPSSCSSEREAPRLRSQGAGPSPNA